MSIEIYKSGQFKINELMLVFKGGKAIDLVNVFDEINLYDSMLLPVMSGKLLITEALGISGQLMFDGSEALLVDITKSDNTSVANFKKAYRIYKQTNKQNIGLNAQKYILHFVSDELIYSDQQRITQSYEMTYSDIVKNILTDKLKVPENSLGGYYEDTTGIRKVVIPNLKPLEALNWCAKRAVDTYNSPNYIFFQNAIGFNFVSLSTLLTKKEVLDIKFEVKNNNQSNPILDLSKARNLEVVDQMDAIGRIRKGVDAGKFVGFDPITRMIATKKVSYADHFNSMQHGNDQPATSVVENREKLTNLEMFDSKKTVSVFGAARQLSKYIQKMDPTSISKEDDTENYKFQRMAILSNLVNKRIRVTMPGNFQLMAGMNVNLMAPKFSSKEKGDPNIDESLSGKYIILSARHIIGFDKHETYIELARTSNATEGVYGSSLPQTQEIIEYQ